MKVDVIELNLTFHGISLNNLGVRLIKDDTRFVVNSIVSQSSSNFGLLNRLDERHGASQTERSEDNTEHNGNDNATSVRFISIHVSIFLEEAPKVERIGIKSADDQVQNSETNTCHPRVFLLSDERPLQEVLVARFFKLFLAVSMNNFDGIQGLFGIASALCISFHLLLKT